MDICMPNDVFPALINLQDFNPGDVREKKHRYIHLTLDEVNEKGFDFLGIYDLRANLRRRIYSQGKANDRSWEVISNSIVWCLVCIFYIDVAGSQLY